MLCLCVLLCSQLFHETAIVWTHSLQLWERALPVMSERKQQSDRLNCSKNEFSHVFLKKWDYWCTYLYFVKCSFFHCRILVHLENCGEHRNQNQPKVVDVNGSLWAENQKKSSGYVSCEFKKHERDCDVVWNQNKIILSFKMPSFQSFWKLKFEKSTGLFKISVRLRCPFILKRSFTAVGD